MQNSRYGCLATSLPISVPRWHTVIMYVSISHWVYPQRIPGPRGLLSMHTTCPGMCILVYTMYHSLWVCMRSTNDDRCWLNCIHLTSNWSASKSAVFHLSEDRWNLLSEVNAINRLVQKHWIRNPYVSTMITSFFSILSIHRNKLHPIAANVRQSSDFFQTTQIEVMIVVNFFNVQLEHLMCDLTRH